jgi:hypothetical protein
MDIIVKFTAGADSGSEPLKPAVFTSRDKNNYPMRTIVEDYCIHPESVLQSMSSPRNLVQGLMNLCCRLDGAKTVLLSLSSLFLLKKDTQSSPMK